MLYKIICSLKNCVDPKIQLTLYSKIITDLCMQISIENKIKNISIL